jgi:hypothetical protein
VQTLLDVAPAALYVFMVFSWMPLLPALLLQVASAASQPPASARSDPVLEGARATDA